MQPAVIEPELKLNPDRLINLEIITRGEQALFNIEIKKKSGF